MKDTASVVDLRSSECECKEPAQSPLKCKNVTEEVETKMEVEQCQSVDMEKCDTG